MPLMVCIPASDWLEHLGTPEQVPQWEIVQTVALAKILAKAGVDWMEVTSGGLDSRQKINAGPGYQVFHADAVKKGLAEAGITGVVVSTVGMITEGKQAVNILEEGKADAVAIGRAFLRNPGKAEVLFADKLHADLPSSRPGVAVGRRGRIAALPRESK
jgi:2,4-dienoyl-CoA reductase-like NADH-dependent reductase (Old Yellow Enzyme family)